VFHGLPFPAVLGPAVQQPPALPIEFELKRQGERQGATDLIIFSENQVVALGLGTF
jgi:hypothetical protein